MYTPIHKNKSEIPSFLLEKANGTRKYSMDCSCPGFPYCFARVYPLKKLDSIYIPLSLYLSSGNLSSEAATESGKLGLALKAPQDLHGRDSGDSYIHISFCYLLYNISSTDQNFENTFTIIMSLRN